MEIRVVNLEGFGLNANLRLAVRGLIQKLLRLTMGKECWDRLAMFAQGDRWHSGLNLPPHQRVLSMCFFSTRLLGQAVSASERDSGGFRERGLRVWGAPLFSVTALRTGLPRVKSCSRSGSPLWSPHCI